VAEWDVIVLCWLLVVGCAGSWVSSFVSVHSAGPVIVSFTSIKFNSSTEAASVGHVEDR
jgi:hypothetical protein